MIHSLRGAATAALARPAARQHRLVVSGSLQRPSPPPQRILDAAEQSEAPSLRPPPRRPPPSTAQDEERRSGMEQQRRVVPVSPHLHKKVTLAVVGDVHSQWGPDDAAALQSLGADVAVFVGDFGEENVQLVEQVAALAHPPKAVILGNHDAWFSLTPNGRRRYARALAARSALPPPEGWSEGGSTPAIAKQLTALGADHVGYASKRFPHLGLSLLGGRPFSKGGRRWSDVAEFFEEHYGIGGHQDSALRMLDVALAAPEEDCKVVVAHNGPAGLGARRSSICGVDWVEPEADHGDPDLQEALDMMAKQGCRVPLVLFGHMHSQLNGRGLRNMAEVDPQSGTVYLNAAVVPRVRTFLTVPQESVSSFDDGDGGSGTAAGSSGAAAAAGSSDAPAAAAAADGSVRGHHFLVVELQHGLVTAARDVWVSVGAAAAADGTRRCAVLQQQELLKTVLPPELAAAAAAAAAAAGSSGSEAAAAAAGSSGASRGEYVCSVYRAHSDEWQPVVVPLPAAVRQAAGLG